MLNLTEALYQLYPTIVRTVGEQAFNANNENVPYNIELVTIQAKKNLCKKNASDLLYATDWTTIPDVADPANSPYLANQADFIAYRNELRKLAVTPVVDPTFPTKPTEVWA